MGFCFELAVCSRARLAFQFGVEMLDFFLHFLKGLIIWVVIGIVNGRDTCKYDTRADYERS